MHEYNYQLINIIIENISIFFHNYLLNDLYHIKILKNTLLIFAIFCMTLTDLNADFKNLPKVQEFIKIVSYDDAVNQLFHGNNYEALEIKTTGSQVKKTYTVISSNKKWFVKIIKEDCKSCSATSFNSEWLLKNDKEKKNLMGTVNAELILPDKGATFMFGNKKHFIVSYPWAPGKTFADIYKDSFKYNKNLDTLKMSFYRYGQVCASMNLDLTNPSDNMDEILNRTPLLLLDDRHEGNEKFFERNEKIYMLDLTNIDIGKKADTVGKTLMKTAIMICQMYKLFLTDSDKEKLIDFFDNKEYITIPAHYFIAGYISKLPRYNPFVIRNMLVEAFNKIFRYFCYKGDSFFCDLVDYLYVLPENR